MEYIHTQKRELTAVFLMRLSEMKKMLSFWNEGISLLASVFLLIIFSYCHAMTITPLCFLLQTHKCWHTAGTYLKEAPRVSSWGKIFIDDPFFVFAISLPFLLVAVLIHTLLGKISERGIKKGKDSLWFTVSEVSVHGQRSPLLWTMVMKATMETRDNLE